LALVGHVSFFYVIVMLFVAYVLVIYKVRDFISVKCF